MPAAGAAWRQPLGAIPPLPPKIARLTDALWQASQRPVRLRLVLEFERSSAGQLRYDALKAFPPELIARAEVYHWPLEKRGRNATGRPGKLHAKLALIDGQVWISSANLTDDAFHRNFELGVLLTDATLYHTLREHLLNLIRAGQLVRLHGPPRRPA